MRENLIEGEGVPSVEPGRRDLIKIGAGAILTTLGGQGALARDAETGRANHSEAAATRVFSGPGYRNDAGRISGNGPMDETSRQLVSYVRAYSEENLTGAIRAGVGWTVLDAIGCNIAGFGSEPGRISARIAQSRHSDLKSTILGYGVTTTPEDAAFANSSMVRHNDFNDGSPNRSGHKSVMIPGILAIGEALHSTGPEVQVALTVGYEVLSAVSGATRSAAGWDAPYEGLATALAAGKLLRLDQDQLANALSIALVPHLPLAVTHVGALSHWKGCHSAMGVRFGVYAALLAREGMTGPAQPFEGRNGLLDRVTGPFKELRMPASSDGRMAVELSVFKRFPAEGNSQAILDQVIPQVRSWTSIGEIESIEVEMPFGAWQEIADPPKWDPRNRETADHSLAYILAVALTDGEVYLSSFTPQRFLEDPAIRQLMQKVTCHANADFGVDHSRVTVRKKTGGEFVKEVYEDRLMSHDELTEKFNRICDYKSVSSGQRDRALSSWLNLQKVPDIAEPIGDLSSFGKPEAL